MWSGPNVGDHVRVRSPSPTRLVVLIALVVLSACSASDGDGGQEDIDQPDTIGSGITEAPDPVPEAEPEEAVDPCTLVPQKTWQQYFPKKDRADVHLHRDLDPIWGGFSTCTAVLGPESDVEWGYSLGTLDLQGAGDEFGGTEIESFPGLAFTTQGLFTTHGYAHSESGQGLWFSVYEGSTTVFDKILSGRKLRANAKQIRQALMEMTRHVDPAMQDFPVVLPPECEPETAKEITRAIGQVGFARGAVRDNAIICQYLNRTTGAYLITRVTGLSGADFDVEYGIGQDTELTGSIILDPPPGLLLLRNPLTDRKDSTIGLYALRPQGQLAVEVDAARESRGYIEPTRIGINVAAFEAYSKGFVREALEQY